jgi:hypothetical protein
MFITLRPTKCRTPSSTDSLHITITPTDEGSSASRHDIILHYVKQKIISPKLHILESSIQLQDQSKHLSVSPALQFRASAMFLLLLLIVTSYTQSPLA